MIDGVMAPDTQDLVLVGSVHVLIEPQNLWAIPGPISMWLTKGLVFVKNFLQKQA